MIVIERLIEQKKKLKKSIKRPSSAGMSEVTYRTPIAYPSLNVCLR